ncbi:T9SS type A sorting domain-containing protein [Flavivirga sp. 57AJ16]|uniref:T9SS type A sorting domain-containing protein n=1 Tax=Flavivirga sp. 57AJ16 TaxID=3025307 RepID=UPI0023661A83|nr:T9SS type A sorting domain-containing protein [Flavivirga sp. 57AJ16]MDD7887840.1 T9SS type A sorting domain-containing protein [Flavivirga sp. 57AJ16]
MKKITLLMLLTLAGISIMKAQVIATGAYSSDATVTITDVTNDEDNGDGANDGAKFMDGSDGSSVNETAYFTFDGTMENGMAYEVSTTVYNVNTSYCDLTVSLYNKTDGTELATANAGVQPFEHAGGDDIKAVTLNYTAVASDEGDVLEVRYVKIQAGAYRNYAVDILELGGVAVGPTVPTTSMSPEGVWSPIKTTILTNTTDDADNGDGVADGAIYVDGQDEGGTMADNIGQGVAFTFDETMEAGDVYNVVTNIYNSGASYCIVTVYLYNVTDGTQLTTPPNTGLAGGGTVAEVTVNYTAVSTDAGDVLELRYVKNQDGNLSRNFSIDNAKINSVAISTDLAALSLENSVLNASVSVYPNPTNSILNINKTNTDINIKRADLFDVTGKIIYSQSNNQTINVSNFSKGLYVLKIESQDGGIATRKIVVK